MSGVLVSVHVPKTGGVAFLEALAEAASGGFIYDYDDRPLVPVSAWKRLRRRLRRATLPPGTRAVHGHFVASKYRHLSDARFLIWFREPVERLVSHYHYWQRDPDPVNPHCRRLIEERLSLEAFAALPEMRNVHRRFLGGIPIERFDFVGLTERFDDSIELFRRLFFANRELPVVRANVNPERRGERYELDPAVRGRIAALNRADMALYEKARERFETLRAGAG